MTLSAALLLVAALAAPEPDFIAAPNESVIDGPFGVLFVPRYDDPSQISAAADADLARTRAYLDAHPDADREELARLLQQRLEGVERWQLELSRQASAAPERAPRLLHAQLGLSAEAVVLQRQLQLLGASPGREAPPTPAPPIEADAPALAHPAEEHVKQRPGDRLAFGRDLIIEADEVARDAVTFGGDVVVLGRVMNDAVAFGGDIVVREGGRIDGHPVSWGGRVLIEPGASARAAPRMREDARPQPRGTLRRLFTMLVFGGCATLVAGALPYPTQRISETGLTRPLASVFIGATAITLGLLVSLLLAITLIGLPFAVIGIAGLSLAWLMGLTALGDRLGRRIPSAWGPSLGLVGTALFVSFAMDFGVLGVLAFATIGTYAVGATVLARFGRAP